jgi:hypothetical protein
MWDKRILKMEMMNINQLKVKSDALNVVEVLKVERILDFPISF